MAFELIKNEWHPKESVRRKEFICDTDDDVKDLPQCVSGSTALVPSSGKVYIVNASGHWVEFGAEG